MTGWEAVAALAVLDVALWVASAPARPRTPASRRLLTYCRQTDAGPPVPETRRTPRLVFGFWSAGRAADVAALRKSLPDALDTLAVCLRAGLGLHAAVAEYAKTATGVAGEVFRGYLAELAVGKAPEDALADLAGRFPLDEIAAVAAAVAQSLRIGAPLAEVFEGQAAHCRTLALHRARESAQRLSTQLVLPLVVFIFPVVFMIGLGPVALKIGHVIGVLH